MAKPARDPYSSARNAAADAYQAGPRLTALTRVDSDGRRSGYKSGRHASDVFGPVWSGDADTDTLSGLDTLRRRAADAARNNPLAVAAQSAEVESVVGTGLRLNAAIDRDALQLSDDQATAWEKQAEHIWRLFSSSQHSDLRQTLTFADQQALAVRSVFERGDHFVAEVRVPDRRPGWPFSFCLQHIEADRVCNPRHQQDTDTLTAGVEKAAHGAPIRYHVARYHPLAMRAYTQGQRWTTLRAFGAETGRRLTHHLYHVLREGQTRGVPALAPVLEVLKQMDRYTDAEVDRAATSALFMAFITTTEPDALAALAQDQAVEDRAGFYQQFKQSRYALDHSSVASLYPGDRVDFADPKAPNPQAGEFLNTFARLTGAALNIPQEVLLRHFSSSYSAARGALLMAWQHFQQRRQWLARYFCQPVYEAVITDAVLQGRLVAPGFADDPFLRRAWLGAEWIGDAPPVIDEQKAVDAAERRINLGISTRRRECAALTGQDYDHVRRQRERELRTSAPDAEPGLGEPDVPPQQAGARLPVPDADALDAADQEPTP